jgi:hypothetical protein
MPKPAPPPARSNQTSLLPHLRPAPDVPTAARADLIRLLAALLLSAAAKPTEVRDEAR